MRIIADINQVKLKDFEPLTSGAYRDKTIDVELSPEYDGFSVWAIFDRQSVKVEGGKCYTPTLEKGICSIGIYAVRLNSDNEIDLRYSPTPALINIEQGSYNSSLYSATTPTESEAEQIYALIDEAIEAGKLRGERGLPGPQGEKGADGKDGKDGTPGKDGYTPIKGVDYFDGTPGKDGAKGDKGEKGDKGDKGEQGEQGEQGLPGINGKDGVDGKNATINGKNAVEILGGDNVSIKQDGDTLKIYASCVMQPLDLSSYTKNNPLLITSLSSSPTDTIKNAYIITKQGYIATSGGKSALVGNGSELLITWLSIGGKPTLCCSVQNGYNLIVLTDEMSESDSVINYLSTNQIKTDISQTLTDRQVLSANYTKALFEQRISKSEIGNGLKFADGKLQLDIPVATAETGYGG